MASYPRVRGACEYCHRRKIRCILPPDSNACHNCAATRTTCLFAPRAKAGRPRRPTGEHIQSQHETPADLKATELALASESLELQLDPLETHTTTELQWNHIDQSELVEGNQLEPQFFFPSYKSRWSDLCNSDELSVPSSSRRHETLANSSLSISPTINVKTVARGLSIGISSGNLTPSTLLSQPIEYSESSGSSGSSTPLDFEVALKLCADLDQRCRSIRDSNCILDAESHFQALDTVCIASINAQPNSDSAIRALTLAAIHKALEICEVLVQACYYETNASETTMLQQLLLLKRLDIVATFGKICFTRMGQATGSKTAEGIHRSIERRLRLEYGHWE